MPPPHPPREANLINLLNFVGKRNPKTLYNHVFDSKCTMIEALMERRGFHLGFNNILLLLKKLYLLDDSDNFIDIIFCSVSRRLIENVLDFDILEFARYNLLYI